MMYNVASSYLDAARNNNQDDTTPPRPRLAFGFAPSNYWQLGLHFALAVMIGVVLRLTTFKEATGIAARIGTTITDNNGENGNDDDDDNNKYLVKTSFLVSFGFTKALSNLVVGRVSDLYGRRFPHAIGWGFGVLLGIMLLLGVAWSANDQDREQDGRHFMGWFCYILANVFLGAQQGWTWTTNIFMFLDMLGSSHRAIASAISNSVGYLASAVTTYLAALVSTETAFGIVLITSLLGCVVSTLLVQDTTHFVAQEACDTHDNHDNRPTPIPQQEMVDFHFSHGNDDANVPIGNKDNLATHTSLVDTNDQTVIRTSSSLGSVFVTTCWQNPSTAVICWGGLTANLVTSFAWGLVLIWGQQQDLTTLQLANIGSAFTLTKGLTMIVSGYCSDRTRRRKIVLLGGYSITALGLFITARADQTQDPSAIYKRLLMGGIIIGSGIGTVYCVLTAGLSDHTVPNNRASAIGVYKLFRDSGYAFGGLLTGWVADASGGSFVAVTTTVAGLVGLLVLSICVFYKELIR